MRRFLNRREAGEELARKLWRFSGRPDVVVLGLARGGVPVAFEVAEALGAPLDVMVVRKLGAPGQEELAFGAVASGGVRVLHEEVIHLLGITPAAIEEEARQETKEVARRETLYRGSRVRTPLRDRTVIVVDDGLATGATMQAAVIALRKQHPKSIIVAAPVVAPDTCKYLRGAADGCEYVYAPHPFFGVGLWYVDFSPTSDEEVRSLLETATENRRATSRTLSYSA